MLPKEKAKHWGIDSLNLFETISLILNKGTPTFNVFQLSSVTYHAMLRALASPKNTSYIQHFEKMNLPEYLYTKMIGLIHFAREIKKLIYSAFSHQILKPTDILPFVSPISNATQELGMFFYLDNNRRLLSQDMVTISHPTLIEFSIRKILFNALQLDSSFLIFVHNHPSGDIQPSKHDIVSTRKLSLILKAIGIHLLDHIIVYKSKYFSFNSAGLL